DGRVAIVTGAARGIGSAVADLLLSEGAYVAALDIDADGLNALLQSRKHPQLSIFPCDVRERAQVTQAVDALTSRLGRPTLLVNVAGVLEPASATEVTADQWHRSFAVNSLGVV